MAEIEQDANQEEIVNPQSMETEQNDPAEAKTEEDRQDRNWKELNRSKEEWKRKALMQEELMARVLNQQPQAPNANSVQPQEDILSDIAKEEYVPGEKVARGLKHLKQDFDRQVQELEKRYQQKEQNSLFSDLKREFPDFEDVVNSETLSALEEHNPRLAMTIASSKDPYAIAIQSYEYIKAKGLYNKPVSKRAAETERKIEQNKKTVASPQTFDKRPIAQAFQMTDDVKKELQREMYNAAQMVGMGY